MLTGFTEGKTYCRADMAKVLQRRSQTLGAMGQRVTKIPRAEMLKGSVVRVVR